MISLHFVLSIKAKEAFDPLSVVAGVKGSWFGQVRVFISHIGAYTPSRTPIDQNTWQCLEEREWVCFCSCTACMENISVDFKEVYFLITILFYIFTLVKSFQFFLITFFYLTFLALNQRTFCAFKLKLNFATTHNPNSTCMFVYLMSCDEFPLMGVFG